MNIAVDGWRATVEDWRQVQKLQKSDLRPLSQAQKEVANRLGVPEEDYARSAEAGRRTQDRLLTKTERFARLMQEKVREKASQAIIDSVVLKTLEHKFEIEVRLDGLTIPIRIDEELADELFESGAHSAEQRIGRILDFALPTGVR